MCLPVAMGNPLSTHTEASTKLITAHQAHHCDDHARSQSREKVSLPKHRAFRAIAMSLVALARGARHETAISLTVAWCMRSSWRPMRDDD